MNEEAQKPNAPLLDREQIEMLLEAGADESVEMFLEILALFEEESQQKLEDMKDARDKGDFETFGRAVHALAGSSANIGGRQVWLTAKELENLCKSGHGQKAVEGLEQLEETYRETVIQLRNFARQIQSGQA
jgi:HPt (histidine-containing phosphotransfer) domain-containing protein